MPHEPVVGVFLSICLDDSKPYSQRLSRMQSTKETIEGSAILLFLSTDDSVFFDLLFIYYRRIIWRYSRNSHTLLTILEAGFPLPRHARQDVCFHQEGSKQKARQQNQRMPQPVKC